MHATRTLLIVSLFLGLAACGGPSKAGKEARAAARDRMEKSSSVIVFDQARQSYEAGQFDKALKEINEAILRTPKEARYWVLRGRINLESARLEPAIFDFEKAEELDPKNAEAMYCQGIVHERWSKDSEAIACYRRASEADPTKVSYLLAWAEVLVAERNYDEAKATLQPRLEYFEHNAPMHQLLGQIAMLRDEPKDAALHFNRALLIDGSQPMVLENLVRAQFAAEQWRDCLQNTRRLQREGEGGRTPERMLLEGRCLAMLGRTSDARNVFSEITREVPEDVQAWVDLAAVSWELGEASRVQSAANRLVRLAPDRYEGYVFLGLVEESKGDSTAAQKWFQKATNLTSDAGEVREMLLAMHGSSADIAAAVAGVSGEGHHAGE